MHSNHISAEEAGSTSVAPSGTAFRLGYDAYFTPEAVNPFPADSDEAKAWLNGRLSAFQDKQW